MTTNKNILISGAGISGLTLAYWLKERGFSPTVIEKRPNLNNRGYMLDFFGSGYDVAERMGITEQLQEKTRQYPMTKLQFVDRNGKPRAKIDVVKFRKFLGGKYFPLMRGDLETVIYEAIKDEARIRFGVSATRLEVQNEAVEVELSDGKVERYDLVIGADGIHSNIRKLMWGDEDQFKRFLGFYVACSVIDNFFDTQNTFLGHFEPKLQASVYSIGGNKLATFFAFKSEKINARGRKEQMEFLESRLANLGWVIPQLLAGTKKADDLFFDEAAQIELPEWHKSRVALVGDACQCLTLLAGQGASMGMAGAYMLADELYKADGDYKIAFANYQQKLKPEIDQKQKDARGLAGSFVPANKFEIMMAHFFFSTLLLPGFGTLFAKQIGAKSIIK